MTNNESRIEVLAGDNSAGDTVDTLPADLDVTNYVGPYLFPGTQNRRIAAGIYLCLGLMCSAGYFATKNSQPVLINSGVLVAGILLLLAGAISLLAGWRLRIDQTDALVFAIGHVGFPVGHASAQLGWHGLRSRPTWKILLYSSEEPPSKRGLVLVDGVDGHILGDYVEDNPEDWTNQAS